MDTSPHWEGVYKSKASSAVSWYRPHLDRSLQLIEKAAPERGASIIDVGGGESTLVDDLLGLGYRNLTVLDISQTALDVTRARLGEAGKEVRWICADITQANLPPASFDVWHDRATFHFLTAPGERVAYVRLVTSAVKTGGHVIISTFGPEGPKRCSGLDAMRYDSESLQAEFGKRFQLIESCTELHQTPWGTNQQFLYCDFRFA